MSQGKWSRWRLAAETVLAVGIVVFVASYFANVLDNNKLREITFTIHYEWLVPAGAVVLARAFVLVYVLGSAVAQSKCESTVVDWHPHLLHLAVREIHSRQGDGGGNAGGNSPPVRW